MIFELILVLFFVVSLSLFFILFCFVLFCKSFFFLLRASSGSALSCDSIFSILACMYSSHFFCCCCRIKLIYVYTEFFFIVVVIILPQSSHIHFFFFFVSTLKIEINEEQFLQQTKTVYCTYKSQHRVTITTTTTTEANNCRSCNCIFYPFYFVASNSHCYNVAYASLLLR